MAMHNKRNLSNQTLDPEHNPKRQFSKWQMRRRGMVISRDMMIDILRMVGIISNLLKRLEDIKIRNHKMALFLLREVLRRHREDHQPWDRNLVLLAYLMVYLMGDLTAYPTVLHHKVAGLVLMFYPLIHHLFAQV